MKSSPLPIEYVAGLIDGKGCIRNKQVLSSSTGNYYPQLWVDISTTEELAYRFREQYGGSIWAIKLAPSRQRKKPFTPTHRVSLVSRGARKLLKEIQPFMIIQKELVDSLLGIKESSGRTDIFLLTGPKEPNIMVVE